jgi:murein DD-endopeptidase MepM/ murein hydrolase activator NlpD
MSGCKRTAAARVVAPALRVLGVVAAVAVAAGCSSDVTRFNLLGGDFLGWAPASPSAPAGEGPAGYAPPGRGYPGGPTGSGYGLQETPLAPLASSGQDYRPPGRDYASSSAAPYPPVRSEQLARAPDRAQPPWSDRSPPPWTDRDPLPGPAGAAEKHKHSGWQGHYVMKSGESLYAVAQRYNVGVDDLKRVNGITDTSKVWAGKVLAVPERAGIANAAAASAPPRVVQATPPVAAAPQEAGATAEPPPRTAARQVGTMTDAAPASAPAPGVAGAKFRWPARGKVIVGFGAQEPDGTKSEGINLALPLGTDIHAVESGRVHYVGDGLKGYGNLILIRHPNGWVSTYAHTDQMLVKAGDEVKRGQVIGKAGTSGPVAQPQLRFELRKGSQPVDPLPLLAN